MKNRLNGQHWVGAYIIFFLFIIILVLNCQNKELTQQTVDRSKFRIEDREAEIEVSAPLYSLFINKATAIARLTDRFSGEYTSFPLAVAFDITQASETESATKNWNVKNKTITFRLIRGSIATQEIKILCNRDNFEIKISADFPTKKDVGVFLLHNSERGFETSGWARFFSPEPDDYQKNTPTVDARVDRDQQWAFTPAPLNLSFKTAPGWFSIGLAELPGALSYAFKNKALWLDYPWSKMLSKPGELFKFPGLIFTFNESPWQAVGQYFNYLKENYITDYHPTELTPQTSWWNRPFVSTWGEQLIFNYTFANENFNEAWVKEYISRQQQSLDSLKFTIIIDDKWSRAYGDPYPDKRFKNLRGFINWCHERGHKVILFWKSWKVEAKSLAIDLDVVDGEYVDATRPAFEAYVDSCCQVMLGSGPGELNADGLKLDHLFLVRDTETARYANPQNGTGLKELYLYMKIFYQRAKQYKPDALIIGSAIDPHFADVQDMVRIGDDWDNKLRREKRARIITQAMPGKLLCGDAAAMYNKIAHYHYVTSAIYGIPSIYYLNQFHDGEISETTRDLILQLVKFAQEKPEGRLRFMDYGHWQIIDDNNAVLSETAISGKGIINFLSNSRALLCCAESGDIHLIFDRYLLQKVVDENKNSVEFDDLGQGIYRIQNVDAGKNYKLHIRKIPELRR